MVGILAIGGGVQSYLFESQRANNLRAMDGVNHPHHGWVGCALDGLILPTYPRARPFRYTLTQYTGGGWTAIEGDSVLPRF